MDETARAILTVSSILFGFFFAAFWWILDRELTFKQEERHFKPATGVLMASMALLAIFGILVPLRHAASLNPVVVPSYRGILLAMVAVYGYMLIELGHYGIYQRPKYVSRSEKLFSIGLLVVILAIVLRWWMMR